MADHPTPEAPAADAAPPAKPAKPLTLKQAAARVERLTAQRDKLRADLGLRQSMLKEATLELASAKKDLKAAQDREKQAARAAAK